MAVIEVAPAPLTVGEDVPARRWRIVLFSALAGLALAIVWSSDLVDDVVGQGVTGAVFGQEAESIALTGSLVGAAFAFITGLAGTFTACNIAVFGAIAPLAAQNKSLRSRAIELLKPIGWLLLGAVAVAGIYGAIGVFIDGIVPQLSDARLGDPEEGLRLRIVQAAVVFGLIGLTLVWMGLAALKIVRFPLTKLFTRYPRAEMLFMGGLIGGFVIGRPFGLFRQMYEYAGATNNPVIGFSTFGLQAMGNIVLMAILFLALALGTRGRFQRWLLAKPGRLAAFSASALIIGGAFFIAYWDLKTGYRAGWWWWPTMPWNA